MRKPSAQTVRVLNILEKTKEPLTGYEIMTRAKLSSGVVYPILSRLEDRKLIEATTTEEVPSRIKRRYELTNKGREFARQSYEDIALKVAYS